MLLRKARGALRRDEQLQAMRFLPLPLAAAPLTLPLTLQAMRFKLVPTRVTEAHLLH